MYRPLLREVAALPTGCASVRIVTEEDQDPQVLQVRPKGNGEGKGEAARRAPRGGGVVAERQARARGLAERW